VLLSHYFSALTDRLQTIGQRMEGASESEKLKLYNEVLQLRQISDTVIEEWLDFEEQLVEVQRMFEQEENISSTNALSSNDKNKSVGEEEIYLPYALAMKFRQGQGYFMLSMYQEAVESFSRVIEEAPDVELARLYLAFGFLMSRRWDVAYRQFRLLVETTDNPLIRAASYNAIGCIAVLEGNAEQGLHGFTSALEALPHFVDARYNQALTLCHLQRYTEAIKTAHPLLQEQQEDVDVLLLLGACYAKTGQSEEAGLLLREAEAIARQAKQHQSIARIYEQMGYFTQAARCYRRVLSLNREEASVWHALGWSLWQTGQVEQAIVYIKHALTLAPNDPDYACSYAWILLCQGDVERARHVFSFVMERHDQPLAKAGLAEVLFKQHRFSEAQAIILELINQKEEHIQALGHYLQGRLFLLLGKREEALRCFSLSETTGVIRESSLYAGLLHYTDGAHEEAYERWKGVIPAR
jgi:tetratricopeptide (TPR) repeat protein